MNWPTSPGSEICTLGKTAVQEAPLSTTTQCPQPNKAFQEPQKPTQPPKIEPQQFCYLGYGANGLMPIGLVPCNMPVNPYCGYGYGQWERSNYMYPPTAMAPMNQFGYLPPYGYSYPPPQTVSEPVDEQNKEYAKARK